MYSKVIQIHTHTHTYIKDYLCILFYIIFHYGLLQDIENVLFINI